MVVEQVFHLVLEDFMLNLFVEDRPYRFPDLLQFETLLELTFDLFAEISLDTLSDVESVYLFKDCLLYTSPSPRDQRGSRMPSSA